MQFLKTARFSSSRPSLVTEEFSRVRDCFSSPALEFLNFLLIGGIHFGGDDNLGFLR